TSNQISHPFHIHINPFQITEIFDPNAPLSVTPGKGTVATSTQKPKQGEPDKRKTITGTGTSFTKDFKIGDSIWINDPAGKVADAPGMVRSITSDTEMTVDVNAKGNLTGGTYQIVVPQYTIERATARPGQCVLNPADPQTWKPCTVTVPPQDRIWWDVFSIPSGHTFYGADATTKVNIPGYFKMRSRFVDYPGYFVLHCHILAHEDRGMMTVVEVAPLQTPYSHH